MMLSSRVCGSAAATATQSRCAWIQQNVSFSSMGIAGVGRASPSGLGVGAVHSARSTPRGRPASVRTSVECRCSPRLWAPVWLVPITPNPAHWASPV